jgi:hypothetical protein
MKQLKPLRLERNAQSTYTRDIAAGSVHPEDEAVLHRITASLKNQRYHRGGRFCCETWSGSADCKDAGRRCPQLYPWQPASENLRFWRADSHLPTEID